MQWNTLVASNLGWLFDGFETYGLILTVGVAMQQLLPPALHPQLDRVRSPRGFKVQAQATTTLGCY